MSSSHFEVLGFGDGSDDREEFSGDVGLQARRYATRVRTKRPVTVSPVKPGQWVTMERYKWPDRPHYRHRGQIQGEDEHGVWLAIAPQPFYRGDVVMFDAEHWVAQLVPHSGDWWAAFFHPNALRFDTYADIGTAPVWRGDDHVSMVDLDLDVIRICDTGEVQIIDEDEFAEHSVLYDYPPDVSAAALVAAENVRSLMATGHAPFDGSAQRWLDLLPQAPT